MTNTFSLTKAVGFGVLIWGIMAGSLALLVRVDALGPFMAHGIVAAIAGVAAFLFALSNKETTPGQALGYGFMWVAIGMLLDLAVTQRFDEHVFSTWQYFLGYALVFFAPLLQVTTHQPKLVMH